MSNGATTKPAAPEWDDLLPGQKDAVMIVLRICHENAVSEARIHFSTDEQVEAAAEEYRAVIEAAARKLGAEVFP